MFETLPGEPCDEGIACARVRQHEHPSVPVRSDVAESICNRGESCHIGIQGKACFVHSIGLSVFVSLCAAAILYLHTGSEQFCCICVVHFLGGIAGIVTPFNAEGDRCGGAVSVVFPAGFFHSRIARVHVLVQI